MNERFGLDPCPEDNHLVGILSTPPYGDLVRKNDKIPAGANFITFNYCPDCGQVTSFELKRKLLFGKPDYLR